MRGDPETFLIRLLKPPQGAGITEIAQIASNLAYTQVEPIGFVYHGTFVMVRKGQSGKDIVNRWAKARLETYVI